MFTIPCIRIFATLTTSCMLYCSLSGMSQSQNTVEVAGINLSSLRDAGYRIDWMNQTGILDLRLPTISGSSLYTIDSADSLSRFDAHTGKWLWSSPVGNEVFELHSITELTDLGYVYIVSDGAVYIVEIATGNYPSKTNEAYASTKQQFPLQWFANTSALSVGNQLIYGSNSGDTIWFNPQIGFNAHRYRIGTSIKVQPTLVTGVRSADGLMRNAIVTSSTDGSVIAVDFKQVNKLWTIQLLGAVESPVAYGTNNRFIGNEKLPRSSVFIAGTDQYLRSVDLHSGRPRWKILTSAKLQDSPVVHGRFLYQKIPSVGLVCFEAFPSDISGNQLWIASEVSGNVITTTRSKRLVCWDSSARQLQIVDSRLGGIVSTVSIPHAKYLLSDKETNGSLYIITDDNMILRLVPRH